MRSWLAKKRAPWLTAFRVLLRRRVLYLDAAPGLVSAVPLNLTENEENEALRDLCGLVLESRTIKFPQCCFARPTQRPCYRGWRGRERKIQHLHHKWLSPRSLSPLHGIVPIPPPYRPHTAWLAAKRPSQICECRMKPSECRDTPPQYQRLASILQATSMRHQSHLNACC